MLEIKVNPWYYEGRAPGEQNLALDNNLHQYIVVLPKD